MENLYFLKNCPKGRTLYSTISGEGVFTNYTKDTITIYSKINGYHFFHENGKCMLAGECVLFPSKDCRDWNKWQKVLIKKGDYVRVEKGDDFLVGFVSDIDNKDKQVLIQVTYYGNSGVMIEEWFMIEKSRWASPEQIVKFQEQLKENGYEIKTEEIVKLSI